jgi:hypothetical protein
MSSRSWTELFFLDEATALAAGHRRCFLCRRHAAARFRAAWAIGNHVDFPSVTPIDPTLHRERLTGRAKRLHPLTMPARTLPDGAMVAASDRSWMIAGGRFYRWSLAGYELSPTPAHLDGLLTPPSTRHSGLVAPARPGTPGEDGFVEMVDQLAGAGRILCQTIDPGEGGLDKANDFLSVRLQSAKAHQLR